MAELLMNVFTRARLGPLPLPYILAAVLLPLWIFFSIGENALLYSLSVIVTILLKGSLLSRWALYRLTSFPLWLVPVSGVIVLQIYIIGEDLQISSVPLVVLVPLSTISGIGIFLLHLDSREEGSSSSQVIGIFSRSSADEYNWLMAMLRPAGRMLPFYITNSNFKEFAEQVSKCTVAILYHSKTRGRVNITNVTDSLYDEEVTHMSKALGREKVFIVVDDLDDSSDGAKSRILQSQTTLRDKTRDLYLFTRQDKWDKEVTRKKLQALLNTLSRGSSMYLTADVVGAVILCVPWFHYIFDVYHGAILVLSNVDGSLLLYHFLLPSNQGSRQAGLPALLLVVVVELVLVYWYSSGMTAGLLAAQPVAAILYAMLTSSLSSSSAGP